MWTQITIGNLERKVPTYTEMQAWKTHRNQPYTDSYFLKFAITSYWLPFKFAPNLSFTSKQFQGNVM